ncbi:hypothetical protein AVEN_160682-1 [Araneus ventricosus]|uniref:Uncharacterized protein n=1 Tax=Araneus ventricosus TaxID=182803 RepID=A0A4Y2JTR1_ARAVE|nr:hypothetical protein AVEN_160682-1 [Araneus ventricosus]
MPGCDQTYDEDWIQCGKHVRSGGMRNVPITKAVEHLYVTIAKFSGCVLLASRPEFSYPPRRQHEDIQPWEVFRHGDSPQFTVVIPTTTLLACLPSEGKLGLWLE